MNEHRHRYESIADMLVAEGFTIDSEKQVFKKDALEILFSDLAKHTVASFIEKARAKDWLPPPEYIEVTEVAKAAVGIGLP